MSAQQSSKQAEPASPEDTVADYLADNPEFFQNRPELLQSLSIPHEVDGALSLIEYQVRSLRRRNEELHDKLHELLDVARDNDRVSERLHRLTLELMSADSLDGAVVALKEGLRGEFQADVLRLCLFDQAAAGHPDHLPAQGEQAQHLRKLAGRGEPVCGKLPREQLDFLFGEAATAVGSSALIPLQDQGTLGLLAVGSYQADRFHRNQGTVFLRRLGALSARSLQLRLR
ncbi:DUF484 family protein [Alkalilimnicola sp. S0819]|uniref:DUF484 family protein n=1 Tax=Alkalilimnicola sp. S0819 TaxID=2613922 RepID=UPI0012620ED9|nr:DUF484 family protein [Alkalilimnicola sp. S0819]KAB7622711.1 DUF484 family protein [Alkalilimnicola sp. S0819]MPQ17351.1 DUF484 family protein [Alkalilimnicola sp. S0819]